ncbi:hypothetical protein HZA57_00040 [Candidatus Poribacteria bacterium]|nr:hypothetical protein [Candidatus Poribacteria bacterium]
MPVGRVRMGRVIQGSATVLFFALMMSLLARDYLVPALRHGNATPVNTALLADQFVGTDDWMRLSLNGTEVGAMRTLSFPDSGGYATAMKLVLESPFLTGSVTTAGRLNERLELQQLVAVADFGQLRSGPIEVAGKTEGRQLYLRLQSPSGRRFTRIALRAPISMGAAANPLLAGNNMTAGETYSIDVYDPLWGMQAGKLRMTLAGLEVIEVEGRKHQTRRIETTLGQVVGKTWADANGIEWRREIRFAVAGEEGAPAPTGGAGLPALMMERMSPEAGQKDYPMLMELPELPEWTTAELRGTDEGEPLGALGILPALLRGRLDAATPGEGEER